MPFIANNGNEIRPYYVPGQHTQESSSTQSIITALGLEKHVEGGYFAEIDRNPLIIPNPFLSSTIDNAPQTAEKPMSGDNSIRNASTSIYYMLTPTTPQGHFHRNKGRTVHTLIEGRGIYVLIHANEEGAKKRVESFVVGKDVSNGERAVWVVEGGKFKASFLLPLEGETDVNDKLLISETVIPGFEYSDHDFLPLEKFRELVTDEQKNGLEWLVRRE